jgi:hypothetical protein
VFTQLTLVHAGASTWAYLFDTKSGKKLHKRAKSEPITTYIPHVLEPIDEEREDNNTPVFKFLAQPVAQKHSPTKTDREAPLPSTDRIAEDDDAGSILTTCTVLIQQLGLADVPEEEEDEENEEDRHPETADTMTITHPEVTKIKVSKSNLSRGTTEKGQESPILGLETSQPITTNDTHSRKPSIIRIECSGALHPREILVNVDGSETDAKSSKSKRKTSSAASSVTSLFTKLLGSGKAKDTGKMEKETKTEPSALHKLRHKAKGSLSLGRLADFIQPAETRLRSSLGINRNDERSTTECNK